MAVDLDVVAGLANIDPVEHVKEALLFKGDGELFVDHVEENVGCPFVGRSNRKVVNLPFEDNSFAGDGAGV